MPSLGFVVILACSLLGEALLLKGLFLKWILLKTSAFKLKLWANRMKYIVKVFGGVCVVQFFKIVFRRHLSLAITFDLSWTIPHWFKFDCNICLCLQWI